MPLTQWYCSELCLFNPLMVCMRPQVVAQSAHITISTGTRHWTSNHPIALASFALGVEADDRSQEKFCLCKRKFLAWRTKRHQQIITARAATRCGAKWRKPFPPALGGRATRIQGVRPSHTTPARVTPMHSRRPCRNCLLSHADIWMILHSTLLIVLTGLVSKSMLVSCVLVCRP